jgi:L-aminopeptidase/D-esterase-like protein
MTTPEQPAEPLPTAPWTGATNSLVDVAGIRVGHHTAATEGWLTGTTLILTGPAGAVGGVDVRGGGPGTRETDVLEPRNAGPPVHAVVLTGGSAFGLAAADGAMQRLEADGRGVSAGPNQDIVVPIVPTAVVFDVGRGGDVSARPDPSFGRAAYDAASSEAGRLRVPEGCVGAGTGAVAGLLKGGVGSASAVLASGETVAALAVVNSLGSTVDPNTGELYGARFGLTAEFAGVVRPTDEEVAAYRAAIAAALAALREPVLNTTIGVVATDATLTTNRCARLAMVAHDGMARSIRPTHTMFDGDTVFALATQQAAPPADEFVFNDLLTAAADCFARAVVHAVLAAALTETTAGRWLSYRDVFPSAFGTSE